MKSFYTRHARRLAPPLAGERWNSDEGCRHRPFSRPATGRRIPRFLGGEIGASQVPGKLLSLSVLALPLFCYQEIAAYHEIAPESREHSKEKVIRSDATIATFIPVCRTQGSPHFQSVSPGRSNFGGGGVGCSPLAAPHDHRQDRALHSAETPAGHSGDRVCRSPGLGPRSAPGVSRRGRVVNEVRLSARLTTQKTTQWQLPSEGL